MQIPSNFFVIHLYRIFNVSSTSMLKRYDLRLTLVMIETLALVISIKFQIYSRHLSF